MNTVYDVCPQFENNRYLLRLVRVKDCSDLLKVYSDKDALKLFNSDNCGDDNFYYTTKHRMKKAIDYWLWEYNRRGITALKDIQENNHIRCLQNSSQIK